MSLDITLRSATPTTKQGTGVFVRENGANVELSVEQIKERWPDSNITAEEWTTDVVFDANITHNLNKMADEAGVYDAMWRPDEHGYAAAVDVIEALSVGLVRLLDEPDRFRAFNPSNGWGTYDLLVDTVRAYLTACVQHPTARIEVSR